MKADGRASSSRRSFGANDVAAVVFTGRNDASQDFTNNPRLLLAAVDKFVGQEAAVGDVERSSIPPHVSDATGQSSPGRTSTRRSAAYRARAVDGLASASCRSSWRACMAAARRCSVRRRISTTNIDQAMGSRRVRPRRSCSRTSAMRLPRRSAANVAIYTHRSARAAGPGDDLIGRAAPRDVDPGMPDRVAADGSAQRRRRACAQVAVDTGGFAVLNTNDFATAFDRIVRENSSLLPAWLLPDQRQARRPVAEAPGACQATGAESFGRAPGTSRRAARRRPPWPLVQTRPPVVGGRRARQPAAGARRGDAGVRRVPSRARPRTPPWLSRSRSTRHSSISSVATALWVEQVDVLTQRDERGRQELPGRAAEARR